MFRLRCTREKLVQANDCDAAELTQTAILLIIALQNRSRVRGYLPNAFLVETFLWSVKFNNGGWRFQSRIYAMDLMKEISRQQSNFVYVLSVSYLKHCGQRLVNRMIEMR